MTNQSQNVCLLTDFGSIDHYVADIKGVLIAHLPHVQIVDLTHHIPSQNIRAGAYQLLAGYRYQPHGTLFLCVVDPGVGGARKILYAETEQWKFIGPDNGLLSWTLEQTKPTLMIYLDEKKTGQTNISSTFHGRDIMAPVAGKILSGRNPREFGEETSAFVKIPFPVVLKHGALWQGEVIAVDAFGNLITNFLADQVIPLAQTSKLWIEFEKNAATVRGLTATYADGETGKPIALPGSGGFIEISVNHGNAASQLGLGVGDRVNFYFRS